MNRFGICIAVADPLRSSKSETILGEDGYDTTSFRSAEKLRENFERRRPRDCLQQSNRRLTADVRKKLTGSWLGVHPVIIRGDHVVAAEHAHQVC